jgi:hypothetical protein
MITTSTTPFERSSKRRKGFPSETHVTRGLRFVRGDKDLYEKLGRNDLCPCGSGRRFQTLLPFVWQIRWNATQLLFSVCDRLAVPVGWPSSPLQGCCQCFQVKRGFSLASTPVAIQPTALPKPRDRGAKPLTPLPLFLPQYFLRLFSPKMACQAPEPPNPLPISNIRLKFS